MTKAPRNGDAAVPDLNSRFYRSDVNPLWARGQAPGAPGWNADALGSSTWYAYGRMLELGFSPDQLLPIVAAGTAAAFQWAIHARNIVGVAVNSEPLPGSIAVDSKRDGPTSNGHVAVVEAVNGDMITVTESSRVSADGANSAWNFLWRHRTVPKTAFAEYIHIAHTQVFSSKAAGPLSGRALDVRIQTPPEDVATDGQVFIAAAVGKTVYFLTTAGWQLWTEGDFPSYFAGALPLALSVQLLDGSFDVSLLLGAQIYVGYGRNAAEMLANRRYAVVHTLH